MASQRHVWSKFFPPGLSSWGDLLLLLQCHSHSASQSVAEAWSNWVDKTSWDWLVLINVMSSLLGPDMDCDVLHWQLGIYSCTFIHNISIKQSSIMHIPLAHLLYCLLYVMPLHTCSICSSVASTILLLSGALRAKDIVHHIFDVRDSKILVRDKTRWHTSKCIIVLCGHHMRGCCEVHIKKIFSLIMWTCQVRQVWGCATNWELLAPNECTLQQLVTEHINMV